MSQLDSGSIFNDASSTSESALTFRTGSTVWGPGALTGKALKAVGETGLDVVMNIVIRRRLAGIKQVLGDGSVMFVNRGDSEEVRLMEYDLKELHRPCYMKSIRKIAKVLLRDVMAYKRLAIIRDTLEETPRIVTDPQGPEEEEKMGQAYEDLAELLLSGPGHCPSMEATATHILSSIVDRCRAHEDHPLLLDYMLDHYAYDTGALDLHSKLRPTPRWAIRWEILLHCFKNKHGGVKVTKTTVTYYDPSLTEPETRGTQRLDEIFHKYEKVL